MEIGWDILWFIIGVSLLVTVHEFGHFWVARKLGFKVLRFSVGFGKPLLKKVGRAPDHTEYVIAAVPLGGYVRMLDERDGAVPPEDLPRAFASRPPWQRILVLLAGPAANILFAILVLWGMFLADSVPEIKPVIDDVATGSMAASAGLRAGDELRSINGTPVRDQTDAVMELFDAISDEGEARIAVQGKDGSNREIVIAVADTDARHKLTEPLQLNRGLGFDFWQPTRPALMDFVEPGGPADKAGFQAGDLVVAIDGQKIHSFDDLASYVNARPATEMLVTARRDGSEITRRVTTASDVDEQGKPIGRLMVRPPSGNPARFIPEEMKARSKPAVFAALGAAVGESWQLTVKQAKFFGRMLTGQVSTKNISGFIAIADYAGGAARAGVSQFLMLLVLLSLSLGFLNLLPIPILDGGQIVYQVIEWAKGGPLSDRAYLVGQQMGLVLLALLMGLAVFNDLTAKFGANI
jgi:regulator of sigma E protease